MLRLFTLAILSTGCFVDVVQEGDGPESDTSEPSGGARIASPLDDATGPGPGPGSETETGTEEDPADHTDGAAPDATGDGGGGDEDTPATDGGSHGGSGDGDGDEGSEGAATDGESSTVGDGSDDGGAGGDTVASDCPCDDGSVCLDDECVPAARLQWAMTVESFDPQSCSAISEQLVHYVFVNGVGATSGWSQCPGVWQEAPQVFEGSDAVRIEIWDTRKLVSEVCWPMPGNCGAVPPAILAGFEYAGAVGSGTIHLRFEIAQ